MNGVRLCTVGVFVLCCSWSQLAWPDIYRHDGTVTLCSSACNSVDALALGSQFDSTIVIDVGPSEQFEDDDITYARLSIFNPALPLSGPFGDPATDNPLILEIATRTVASNGTVGMTDDNQNLVSGQMLLELLQGQFRVNQTYLVFDLSTGDAQICLFFPLSGCIPMATEVAKVAGEFVYIGSDADGDLASDPYDNCTEVSNPFQIDSNLDSIGNRCDADLGGPAGVDVGDCVVNAIDLGIMKSAFFSVFGDSNFNRHADLTGIDGFADGHINVLDLGVLKQYFFGPPGPSAHGCN